MIKWLLKDPQREADTERATRLVERVTRGEETAVQPPHWILEVGAVLARLSPATAADDVIMLGALALPVADDPLILRRAVGLAVDLGQHVFDTCYHAIALEIPEAMLVTADRRYLRAARSKGKICDLKDWS